MATVSNGNTYVSWRVLVTVMIGVMALMISLGVGSVIGDINVNRDDIKTNAKTLGEMERKIAVLEEQNKAVRESLSRIEKALGTKPDGK